MVICMCMQMNNIDNEIQNLLTDMFSSNISKEAILFHLKKLRNNHTDMVEYNKKYKERYIEMIDHCKANMVGSKDDLTEHLKELCEDIIFVDKSYGDNIDVRELITIA